MRPSLSLAILACGSVGEVQSCVGQPLALALAVQPDQVIGRRCRDAALLGQPLQHLPVAFAAVAADDRAQRRIGLHRRGVDADPVALDQAVLGQPLQHPGEDRLVHLERQARARLAEPGMVGHPLAQAQPQELPQATGCRRSAIPGRARCRSPRSSRPDGSGSSGPAATTAGPACWRSRARTAARRSRRTQPRPAPPAGDRRRRAPASAAAPPSPPSALPAARPAVPAPCPSPHRHGSSESAERDFVNGLLSCLLSSTLVASVRQSALRQSGIFRSGMPMAGGRAARRRLSKLSCAGWLPHDRGCVSGLPRSRCEPRLTPAHNRRTRVPQPCPAARSWTSGRSLPDQLVGCELDLAGDRPDEADHLASDRGGDHHLGLAGGDQMPIAPAQPESAPSRRCRG